MYYTPLHKRLMPTMARLCWLWLYEENYKLDKQLNKIISNNGIEDDVNKILGGKP